MTIRSLSLSIAFIAVCFLMAPPGLAQLPKASPPKGMLELSAGGAGRILTSRMSGTESAKKMLTALKIVSREYFDGPITITRAFADPDDRNVQAAFTAKLKGVPVRGIAAVVIEGESGQGTLLFDNAKTFSASFKKLVSAQNGGSAGAGKASGRSIKLTPQTAPDGSGTISLPDGYRIANSYQGTMDIVGPNGAMMALGAPIVCTRPEAAAYFPGIPPVDFNDPARAAIDFMNYQSRRSGVATEIKVIDARPVPNWPTGRAAFLRYSAKANGKSFEGFGLFSIAPTDVNQALLYMSYIAAPTSSYRTAFPEMMAAWATYGVNAEVLRGRLMAAAQSMRGMSDIISGAYTERQKTEAKVSEAWSDYMRDQGTWSNPTTGNRYKISNVYTNNGGIPMQNGVALQPVPLSDL